MSLNHTLGSIEIKISVKMGRHIRGAGDKRRCHWNLEGWGEFGEEVVGGDSEKRYKRCG